MADEITMQQAKATYDLLINSLDNMGLKYTRHDDDLVITLGMNGDDIPMELLLMVRAENKAISLISPMPFKMAEDKRVDGAIAVSVANYGIVNGCFDYDIADGEIRFRVVQSYIDSVLGAEVIRYMIAIAVGTVDKYNDRFLMLSKGMIDLQKFIELDSQN